MSRWGTPRGAYIQESTPLFVSLTQRLIPLPCVCVCTCKRLGDMIHSNNFNIYLMKCFYSCTHKHTLGVFSFFSSSPFVCLFQFLCTVLLALVNIFSHICWSRANIYVLDRCCGIFVAMFFIPQNIIHSYMFTYIHTLSQVEIRLAFDCKCNSSRRQVLLVGWSELSTVYTEKSHTTLFILPPPLPPPPSVVLHFFLCSTGFLLMANHDHMFPLFFWLSVRRLYHHYLELVFFLPILTSSNGIL